MDHYGKAGIPVVVAIPEWSNTEPENASLAAKQAAEQLLTQEKTQSICRPEFLRLVPPLHPSKDEVNISCTLKFKPNFY